MRRDSSRSTGKRTALSWSERAPPSLETTPSPSCKPLPQTPPLNHTPLPCSRDGKYNHCRIHTKSEGGKTKYYLIDHMCFDSIYDLISYYKVDMFLCLCVFVCLYTDSIDCILTICLYTDSMFVY